MARALRRRAVRLGSLSIQGRVQSMDWLIVPITMMRPTNEGSDSASRGKSCEASHQRGH